MNVINVFLTKVNKLRYHLYVIIHLYPLVHPHPTQLFPHTLNPNTSNQSEQQIKQQQNKYNYIILNLVIVFLAVGDCVLMTRLKWWCESAHTVLTDYLCVCVCMGVNV